MFPKREQNNELCVYLLENDSNGFKRPCELLLITLVSKKLNRLKWQTLSGKRHPRRDQQFN